MAAVAAALLAFTARFWLPALPTLFGAIEANRELIGAFADLSTIATAVMLLIGAVLAYLGFRNLWIDNGEQSVHQSVTADRGDRDAPVDDANREPGEWAETETVASDPSASVRARTELREGFDRFQRARSSRGLDRVPRHGALEVAVVTEGSEAPTGYPTEEFLNRLNAANPGYTGWPLWLDSRGHGESDQPYTLDGGWEALIYEHNQGSSYNHLDFWCAHPAGRFYAYRGFEDDLGEGPTYPEAMTTLDFRMAIWRVTEAIAVPMAFAQAMGLPPEETTVVYAFRWSGLSGRRLSSWTDPARYVHARQESRQNVEEPPPVAVPLDMPSSALGTFVREATSGLFATFGGFEPSSGVTEGVCAELLARGH